MACFGHFCISLVVLCLCLVTLCNMYAILYLFNGNFLCNFDGECLILDLFVAILSHLCHHFKSNQVTFIYIEHLKTTEVNRINHKPTTNKAIKITVKKCDGI